MQQQMGSQKKPSQGAWLTRLNIKKAREWGLTDEQFEWARKAFEGLTLKEFLKKNLPGDIAELIGPTGERAYVRDDDLRHYEIYGKLLVVEIPLTHTAKQKREATRQAANFFERLHVIDQEAVEEGQPFTRVTRKPYEESIMWEGDPKEGPLSKCRVRMVWVHKWKRPYGSQSSQKTVLAKRNAWIKKRYKRLRAQYGRRYRTFRLCETIQQELAQFSPNRFGKSPLKKRSLLGLSLDAIQRIATASK